MTQFLFLLLCSGWLLFLLPNALAIASDDEETIKPLPSLEVLALQLMDGEALYTLSGGLKPVSEGFVRSKLPRDEAESMRIIAEMRSLLSQLPLGPNVDSGVLEFKSDKLEYRSAAGFIAHRPCLQATILKHSDYFAEIGVSVLNTAQEVMDRINAAKGSLRSRGFGLVFGYPEEAVDFFVQASDSEKKTGKFVERDFFQIPTHESDRGRFVFAVPKGEPLKREYFALKEKAVMVLDRYQKCRKLHHEQLDYNGVYLMQRWVDQDLACSIAQNIWTNRLGPPAHKHTAPYIKFEGPSQRRNAACPLRRRSGPCSVLEF